MESVVFTQEELAEIFRIDQEQSVVCYLDTGWSDGPVGLA